MTDLPLPTNSIVENDDTIIENPTTTAPKPPKNHSTRKRLAKNRKRVKRNQSYARTTVALFIPVTICMAIVLISLTFLPFFATSIDYSKHIPEGSFLVENEKSSASSRILPAIILASIFLCLVIAVTTCMAIIIARKCYRTINTFFMVSFAFILVFSATIYIFIALNTFNIPLDLITTALLIWNYAIVGLISIYGNFGYVLLKRAYLVMTCAMLVLIFIKLLPSWTTWTILLLLCLWDIYAVFFGPLKTITDDENVEREVVAPVYSAEHSKSDDQTGGDFEIGLGDIIFYSLLVGKTYSSANMLTAIICFVAVLMGMTITLYLLLIWKRALPALPISIVFGLFFRFIAVYFMIPFNSSLVSRQIFL